MGPGQQPFGHWDNDVPHFNRERHFRTQESQEKRRRRRINEEYVPEGATTGYLANFLFVGGIISLGVFVPSFLFETFVRSPSRKHGKEE